MVTDLTFLGGAVLGLLASVHCAAMCGPVAAAWVLFLAPEGGSARVTALLSAQAGKIIGYCCAGAVLGRAGAQIYPLLDRELGYRLFQVASAGGLIVVGLSWAGIIRWRTCGVAVLSPLVTVMDRVLAGQPPASPCRRLERGARAALLGVVWGGMPCAMVYAALFTAMLTGSASSAALFMAGFGMGTVPAVTASAFGVTLLPRIFRGRQGRQVAGLCLIAAGLLSVFFAAELAGVLCPPGQASSAPVGNAILYISIF